MDGMILPNLKMVGEDEHCIFLNQEGRCGIHKIGLKLWWAVLLIAVATGIFGMLLLVDPAGGAKLTVIFTGVAFLLEGILKLCVVVYTVKIRENENVVWEDEFREI